MDESEHATLALVFKNGAICGFSWSSVTITPSPPDLRDTLLQTSKLLLQVWNQFSCPEAVKIQRTGSSGSDTEPELPWFKKGVIVSKPCIYVPQ